MLQTDSPPITPILEAARTAARTLATTPTGLKNLALHGIAAALRGNRGEILAANALDLAAGSDNGVAAGRVEDSIPGGKSNRPCRVELASCPGTFGAPPPRTSPNAT